LYFGVVLEVLMFAFALGERLNTLRDEKEKAQAEYIKLAKLQTRELEEKVEARTKELQVQSKYLEEVNATKDKLFSILGHDLRGPIANLKAMLDLAASNDISGEDFLQQTPTLSRGVENVLYILEDLLQWSYAQRKGIKSFPVEIDLHTITNQKLEVFKELAASKK
jgi:signal transduction histidine kinase